MGLTHCLFYAFLASGLCNFICSVLILRALTKFGIKVSFYETRWQVHKHLSLYRRMLLEKTGKIAWPYYGYQASLVAMVGFALLALISTGQ